MTTYCIDPLARCRDPYVLRPCLTERVVRTWRREPWLEVDAARRRFKFPTRGCHGAPLQNDFPNRTNGP